MVSLVAIPQEETAFTNLSRVLAQANKPTYQYVRVLNGVANVTDGKLIIRRAVQVPDGCYNILRDGTLGAVTYPHGLQYPDIEILRPPFEKMVPSCTMQQPDVVTFLSFAIQAAARRGTIAIQKDGAFLIQDQSMAWAYPFNVPEPIEVQAQLLSVALMELRYYPQIHISKEEVSEDSSRVVPLVIGLDWGHCALLINRRYDLAY